VVAGLGLALLLTSSFLGLDEIVVVGSAHLGSEEIVRLCDVEMGTNLLRIATGEVRERLLGVPRVAEATVRRQLPGRLVIQVVEREGVVLLPCQERFVELDENGLPLDFHRFVGALGLPIVTGVTVEGVTLGQTVKAEGLEAVLACGAALGAAGRPAFSEIHVNEKGELVLYTVDGIPVYLGQAADLDAKVAALLGILEDLELSGIGATYIDVRSPRYPAVGSRGEVPATPQWHDPDVYPVVWQLIGHD